MTVSGSNGEVHFTTRIDANGHESLCSRARVVLAHNAANPGGDDTHLCRSLFCRGPFIAAHDELKGTRTSPARSSQHSRSWSCGRFTSTPISTCHRPRGFPFRPNRRRARTQVHRRRYTGFHGWPNPNRFSNSAPQSSAFTRHCCSVSRSRNVTVRSASV